MHHSLLLILPLAIGWPLLTGCGDEATSNRTSPTVSAPTGKASSAWFEEVAKERGIDHQWVSGHGDRHLMPECIGGGGALFDMDNDGDLDAYLVQAGSLTDSSKNLPNVLLRNDGRGHFEEVADAGGADGRDYGMGVACGDYDNDGDVDLYVTNYGTNVLYQNDGTGKFSNVTDATRVGQKGWSTSAAFFDYDNDGDLDLYVCKYVNWSPDTEIDCFNDMGALDYCAPTNYKSPAMDVLYRNDGPPNYSFTDVSIEAGLDAWFGNGLGVAPIDFNRDGFMDIFVANDGMRNQLWLNQKNGAFVDVGLQAGCAMDDEGITKAGMGVAAADIDDDADTDLLVCNLRRESDSLFVNQGEFFQDGTAQGGLRTISRPFTRFGVGLADFDNDGVLDLYEANGMVLRNDIKHSSDPYAEPNLLFRGVRAGANIIKFQEVKPRGGTSDLLVATSRAAAFGDIDNDGGIDVLVINRDGNHHLLHNIVANRGHWITLRIVDEHGRDAHGAVVTLSAGNHKITREVRPAYSYCASNDPRVHAGLGQSAAVDEVTVRWVDGATQSFGKLDADKIHILQRK